MQILEYKDIHVYETLSLSWRAYVRSNPNIQVWGSTRERAVNNLARKLVTDHNQIIGFDFSGAYDR